MNNDAMVASENTKGAEEPIRTEKIKRLVQHRRGGDRRSAGFSKSQIDTLKREVPNWYFGKRTI